MTRLAALLALSLACGAAGSAAQAQITSPCENYVAPALLPYGHQLTRIGTWRITADDNVVVLIPRFGETVVGQLVPTGGKPLTVTVFEAYGGVHFLSTKSGNPGEVVRDDGTVYGFDAGRLLSELDLTKRSFTKTQCVRIEGEVFVSPRKARSLGYEIETGELPPAALADAPEAADPVPEDDGPTRLADLKPKEDADDPEESEDSLGGLFSNTGEDEAAKPDDETLRDKVEDTVAEVVAAPVTQKVCHTGTGLPYQMVVGETPPRYSVAGILRESGLLPAYRQVPGFDDMFADPAQVRVADNAVGQLVALAQPFGLRPQSVDGQPAARIARLLDPAPLTPISAEDVAAAEPAQELIRLLVISDADTLAQSGLDRFERQLLDWSGRQLWRVDWAEVTADGVVLPPVKQPTMATMVDAAQGRDSSFSATEEASFDMLMQGITDMLAAEDQPLTKVLWLIEGHILPHSAPARFARMIEEVGGKPVFRDGRRVYEGGFPNVAVRADGRRQKWLEVIAGYYNTPYAQYYLDGPIKTTTGGNLTVEQRDDSGVRDVILNTPKELINRIKLTLAGKTDPVEDRPEPTKTEPVVLDGLLFPRPALVSEAGLLLSRDAFDEFQSSIALAETFVALMDAGGTLPIPEGAIDVLSLASFRTNDSNALEPMPFSSRQLRRRIEAAKRPRDQQQLQTLRGWFLDAASRTRVFASDETCAYLFFPDTGL